MAGNATLLNCLTAAIPSGERVVTCEGVLELSVGRLSNQDHGAEMGPRSVRHLTSEPDTDGTSTCR